jgi:hypothetical protein
MGGFSPAAVAKNLSIIQLDLLVIFYYNGAVSPLVPVDG